MPHANPTVKQAYQRAYQAEWRRRRAPHVKAQQASYYQANRETIRERLKWTRLLRRYGLTKERYEAMLLAQDGRCACCGYPPTGSHALGVDHCHETGRVRGLLCKVCNRLIERVDAYLKKTDGRDARTA